MRWSHRWKKSSTLLVTYPSFHEWSEMPQTIRNCRFGHGAKASHCDCGLPFRFISSQSALCKSSVFRRSVSLGIIEKYEKNDKCKSDYESTVLWDNWNCYTLQTIWDQWDHLLRFYWLFFLCFL
jgi:hypothetical protein